MAVNKRIVHIEATTYPNLKTKEGIRMPSNLSHTPPSLLIVIVFLITLFQSTATTASGQDADRLVLTVTQLAGENVYLDGGSDLGIAKGDTLMLDSDEQKTLIVIAVSRKQAIVQFAGGAFPVTRGQQITLRTIKGTEKSEPAPEPVTSLEEITETDQSIMNQPSSSGTRTRAKERSKIEVDGRLIFDFSALQSHTKIRSNAVPAASRLYLTPTVNLSASVRNLPSGMNMHFHVRSDYRYQSRNPIAPTNSFRAYQISLEKPLPFGSVRFGRFYNRMTQRGGYWDGISFLYGDQKRGIGGSVGFMPNRSNEGFSTQLPRYAVFAHYQTERRKKTVWYRGAIAYNEIQPTTDFMQHRFASLEQRVDISILSLRQDIQVDYQPVSKQWIVSHLRLGGRLSIGPDVDLTGTYTLRQPYRMSNIANPFASKRDQYRVGLSLHRPLFSVGSHYTRRFLNESYQGQTVTGYFNTRPITPLSLSFSGSASRWESEFGDALYFNGGIAKNIHTVYLRADYGFYRTSSPNIADYIDMHRLSLTASVPFSRRLYWTLRGTAQQSQFTSAFSIQTSLQIRF